MAINKNRIVPVTDIDLITLYNMILNATGTTVTAIAPGADLGHFTVAAANKICNEPAVDVNVTASSGAFYFVAAHDFAGLKVNGTAVTPSGATIVPDGVTLYKGTISSGAITIALVTPGVPA